MTGERRGKAFFLNFHLLSLIFEMGLHVLLLTETRAVLFDYCILLQFISLVLLCLCEMVIGSWNQITTNLGRFVGLFIPFDQVSVGR